MKINFTKANSLAPVIIQDNKSGLVLMLGYMNHDALEKSLQTGFVWFWSRTRQKLWLKGETSGNKLKLTKIISDCDNDAILIKAELIGANVCHTGKKSCFTNQYEI